MPKTTVTLTVLPSESPEHIHERFLQIDCAKRGVLLLAVFAFMEPNWGGWWKPPTVVDDTPKAIDHRSPIMWVRGGAAVVDRLLESTKKKLSIIPNVEVIVVRKDMPTTISQGE